MPRYLQFVGSFNLADVILGCYRQATMVEIQQLSSQNDGRGWSCPLGDILVRALSAPKDAHLATIEGMHIRGNHFHNRSEVLVVLFRGAWTFAWDNGEGTLPASRSFVDEGAVMIHVPPLASHAIRNDSELPLILLSASDGIYCPANPDAQRRIVLK